MKNGCGHEKLWRSTEILPICHRINCELTMNLSKFTVKLKELESRKVETQASSHEGQCIPAGSSVSLPRRVVDHYVNNNHA